MKILAASIAEKISGFLHAGYFSSRGEEFTFATGNMSEPAARAAENSNVNEVASASNVSEIITADPHVLIGVIAIGFAIVFISIFIKKFSSLLKIPN